MWYPGRDTSTWACSLPHLDFGFTAMASEILSEYNILLKIPTGLWVRGEGKIHTDVAQSIVQESSGYGP